MGKRDQLIDWIEMVLAEKGWSGEEWCRRAQVASSTLSRFRGAPKFLLSNKTLEKLETAAGIPFSVPLSREERFMIALTRQLSPRARSDVIKMIRAVVPDYETPENIEVLDNEENVVVYSGPERRRGGLHDQAPEQDRRKRDRYTILKTTP